MCGIQREAVFLFFKKETYLLRKRIKIYRNGIWIPASLEIVRGLSPTTFPLSRYIHLNMWPSWSEHFDGFQRGAGSKPTTFKFLYVLLISIWDYPYLYQGGWLQAILHYVSLFDNSCTCGKLTLTCVMCHTQLSECVMSHKEFLESDTQLLVISICPPGMPQVKSSC